MTNTVRTSFFFSTLAGTTALLMAGASAQQAVLDDVVVTATRLPTSERSIAASVTVITAEEIERKQLRTLPQALASVPGFSVVRSGGVGATTSVFARGTNSNQVLYLVNGRRVGDPAGSGGRFDPSAFLTGNIERIEILRGPRSVLYGSDAIGAVINIITKKGGGAAEADARIEAGSFRTLALEAGAGGAIGGTDVRLDAAHLETDGESIAPRSSGAIENDGFINETASLTLGHAPAGHLYVEFFGHYTRAVTETDGFALDDPNSENLRNVRLAQLEGTGEFFDGGWTVTAFLAVNDQDLDNINPPDNPGGVRSASYFDSQIFEAGLKNDFSIHDGGTLTLGWESRDEKGETGGDAFFNFDVATPTHSGYAQYQFDLFERFSGTAGVRLDDNEDFGSETTYGVSGAYRHLETGTKLWAGVGTGFKAPSLADLFGGVSGLFVGNPDLRPETSIGWEAGVKQELWDGRASFGATYFENRIDDLIEGFVFDPALGLFTAENVSKAETYGVESFIAVMPFDTLEIDVSHTYTRAEDTETGQDLTRRPKHRANADIAWWPLGGLRVSLDTLWTGPRFDIGPARLGSDFITDVAADYAVNERFALEARITNLFDRDNEDPVGFAHPGIGAFAAVRARF